MPSRHIYFSKVTPTEPVNPESGTQLTDWIYVICKKIQDIGVTKDIPKDLGGHTSYRIVMGKFIQSAALQDCIIQLTKATGTTSQYYNPFKKFMVNHWAIGAGMSYPVYFYEYDPSGEGNFYVQWMDNNETWKNYMRCCITGYNFSTDNSGIWRGNVTIQECWL